MRKEEKEGLNVAGRVMASKVLILGPVNVFYC